MKDAYDMDTTWTSRITYCYGLFIFTFLWPALSYSETLDIAIIKPSQTLANSVMFEQLFTNEIKALLDDDYEINFVPYTVNSGANLTNINIILDKVYNNATIDMVLVLDIAANQIVGLRPSFAKPTFLPIVFNANIAGFPLQGNTSGKHNLHYLTEQYDFEATLNSFKNVSAFSNAVMIIDKNITKSVGDATLQDLQQQARNAQVTLNFLQHNGDMQALIASIPHDIDAVLFASIPQANDSDLDILIDTINKRHLASFSITGDRLVKKGVLATNTTNTDWQRLARHNALDMQSVLLGDSIKNLPVFFKRHSRLMINMATARAIRHAPRFDILSNAILLHDDELTDGPVYSLNDVAHKAIEENLTLQAQKLQYQRAGKRVDELKGALLPQINVSLSSSTRKETNNTTNGLIAKRTTDGAINVTQSLYSERRWASYTIEEYAVLSEEQLLEQVKLDITKLALNAYLDVLRAETILEQRRFNLNITRQNLYLAESRVDIGSTNMSDLYRWQSELANAQHSVLSAKSALEQAKQYVNRILNRPINEQFSTSATSLDDSALLLGNHSIINIIDNAYHLQALGDFFVQKGLKLAPELKQLKAQIASAKRQIMRDERAYYVPDVNVTGKYNRNINNDRTNNSLTAERNDWQVGVELSLPLFEGGARAERTAQNVLKLQQLNVQYKDTKNITESNIRYYMQAINASYGAINLTKKSEKSSQKNYDLVAQSYIKGQVSIINLLDSQATLFTAKEQAMNAVHLFLIDLINLQRAIGAFNIFLTEKQRMTQSNNIKNYIQQQQ